MNTILNACTPIISNHETNCNDVEIVYIVCATIVLIIIILSFASCCWHSKNLAAEADLKKQEFERGETRKDNEQKRKQADEDRKNNSNANKSTPPQKTSSEKATDLLKELSAIVKSKEGDINKDTLNKVVDIYEKLKKDFNDEKLAK